jgi:hypothetical protein
MPQLTLQGEQAEVHIRLEADSRSIPTVFALADRVQRLAKRLFPALCRAWLQSRLAEDLGPRYAREQDAREQDAREQDAREQDAREQAFVEESPRIGPDPVRWTAPGQAQKLEAASGGPAPVGNAPD